MQPYFLSASWLLLRYSVQMYEDKIHPSKKMKKMVL